MVSMADFADRRSIVSLVLGMIFIASLVGVSAHVVRSIENPTFATAFVSSPSGAVDAPIPVAWGSVDTGLRVACFYTANTSLPRGDDPAWPRVTAVGFELPGERSGFTLLSPAGDEWQLVEGLGVTLNGVNVTADFALVALVNPVGRSVIGNPHQLLGIPPGQPAARLSGTRFCVAGPFPEGFSIEQILNGAIVRFQGVTPHGLSIDFGVWDNAARAIPLYQ